ncbi:hypothetical protein DSO57_1017243 [Entomophthora muscae]|uniref:Uncharacterized protein n=1 Tax=Entomophthora muscae TaxID=34485 RepID=A0ACC2TFG1_9FUNG|nr:hypothetical protein DSO57_1017243 [Entomophthora muscae]
MVRGPAGSERWDPGPTCPPTSAQDRYSWSPGKAAWLLFGAVTHPTTVLDRLLDTTQGHSGRAGAAPWKQLSGYACKATRPKLLPRPPRAYSPWQGG